MEVECGADAHQQRRRQPGAHPGHPELLLGLSGADPHDGGARSVDLRDRPLVLGGRRLAKRRREAAHDRQPGEALGEPRFEQLERRGRAAPVEIHGVPLACGPIAEGRHQVGPVDAGGAGMPERPQRPDERLPVGYGQRHGEHGGHRLRLLLGAHDEVYGGGGDAGAPVGGDRRLHPVDDVRVVADGQRDTQHLCSLGQPRRRIRWSRGGRRCDCVKIPGPVAIDIDFWRARRVLLTGHTGFKGAWLSLWLQSLGAELTGLGLGPPSSPSLYELAGVGASMQELLVDVRDGPALSEALRRARPEIVMHLAAQPMVRRSLIEPALTYEVNVIGTVNVLEAVRTAGEDVRAVVVVTSDKCYENPGGGPHRFTEGEPLGGADPYSSSKACAS